MRFAEERFIKNNGDSMARRGRVKLKGKVTAFNRCVRKKIKGKKFRNRAAQRAAWRKAVRSCARRY
jgi:hypothetical protein